MTLPAHIQIGAQLPGGVVVTQINADDTFMVDIPCPGGFKLPRKYDLTDLHEDNTEALQATIRQLKHENRMLVLALMGYQEAHAVVTDDNMELRCVVDALLVIVAVLRGWGRG